MRIERRFTTALSPNEARTRANAWLAGAGFARKAESELLERGSLRGNLTSWNPANWRQRVELVVQPDRAGAIVRVVNNVSTIAQIVTPAERAFLENEMKRLEAALGDSEGESLTMAASEPSEPGSWVARLTWREAVRAGITGLVVGLPLGIVIPLLLNLPTEAASVIASAITVGFTVQMLQKRLGG